MYAPGEVLTVLVNKRVKPSPFSVDSKDSVKFDFLFFCFRSNSRTAEQPNSRI